jgi:hypothetical protein
MHSRDTSPWVCLLITRTTRSSMPRQMRNHTWLNTVTSCGLQYNSVRRSAAVNLVGSRRSSAKGLGRPSNLPFDYACRPRTMYYVLDSLYPIKAINHVETPHHLRNTHQRTSFSSFVPWLSFLVWKQASKQASKQQSTTQHATPTIYSTRSALKYLLLPTT